MKKITKIFILTSLFHFQCIAQCWKSISTNADTNSLIYAIRDDHTLWDFTSNAVGVQIGNQNIWEKCISSGTGSTFLLAQDSTLWGWGPYNSYGELGIGHTNPQTTIIQLNNSKWIDLSSSNGMTTAIRDDGTMWFWGHLQPNNLFLTPIQVGLANDWLDVQSSWDQVLALKNNGTIWIGTAAGSFTQIGSDIDWKYIWTEEGEWWGIKNNGTLWYNGFQVGNDNNWQSISGTGFSGTYGIKTNGTLWYWPYYIQTSATFNPLATPTQISNFSTYNSISFRTSGFIPSGYFCIHDNDKLWLDMYTLDASCTSANIENNENVQDNSLIVVPNPIQDQMTIYGLEDLKKIESLSIKDINGKLVKQLDINESSFSLSNLKTGIYFLEIDIDKVREVIKLIKE